MKATIIPKKRYYRIDNYTFKIFIQKFNTQSYFLWHMSYSSISKMKSIPKLQNKRINNKVMNNVHMTREH